MAVSLPNSPLSPVQQRTVVDACARTLLTSHGLRKLAYDDNDYMGITAVIGEIFISDAPFIPRGCFAQAWSVAEMLHTWQLMEK